MRLCTLCLLLLPAALFAQVPQAFEFQGVARDAGGNVLSSQSVGLRLSILSGSPTGTLAYQETQATVTSPIGLFSVQVGNGTPLSGAFASVAWGAASHFLKVELDPAGGSNYQLMGTTQLLSVPYALMAGSTPCYNVSLSGDTLHQGADCYVIVPGISAANGGCSDVDGDGYFSTTGCASLVDCNDNDPAINPVATEVCDGADNDCDGPVDEGFNPGTDPANCGACGNICSFPNATAVCVNGACAIGTCNAGYANCDGNPANGCETSLLNDPDNCGACGVVCTLPNAMSLCVNGACQIGTCDPGFADCDGDPANGCETNVLSDLNNCGACGQSASDGLQCTNDVCTNGVISHPPLPAGSACSQNGGAFCDGAGSCVECAAASACPGSDTECLTRTCVGGVCGYSFAAAGTVVSSQTSGDCKITQCDGAGNIVVVNDNVDLPVDGNQCTNDVCTAGTPSNPPSAAGTLCSGGACDGTGTCVSVTPEVEPNGTRAQADSNPVQITGSQNIAGAITPAADLDYFKLVTPVATVWRFETFDNSGADCTGGIATRLNFRDNAGTPIKTDATSGISTCSAISYAFSAGTYYIQAEAATISSTVAAYQLQASVISAGSTEVEPNDVLAVATVLSGLECVAVGSHQVTTDADWYAITVPAGNSVRAELIEGNAETCESNGVDSQITLFNAAGTQLVADDDDGRGFCSLIDGTGSVPRDTAAHNLASGTYYLRVQAAPSATGAAAQFDYRLVVTIR